MGGDRAVLARSTRAAALAAARRLRRPAPRRPGSSSGRRAAEADVTVGCMFPMTGRSAIYGRDSVGGIRVALEQLPRARERRRRGSGCSSTTPGRRRRTRSGSPRTTSAATKARFLCGVVSSGVGQAVSRLAARARLHLHRHRPRLVAADHRGLPPPLLPGLERHLRVDGGRRALPGRLAEDAAGWRRLAFIGPDYDYGHVSCRTSGANLDRLGVALRDGRRFLAASSTSPTTPRISGHDGAPSPTSSSRRCGAATSSPS